MGKTLYTHTYTWDENKRIIAEELIGNLGKVEYSTSSIIKSPYHMEICIHDKEQNIIWRQTEDSIQEYDYNENNELIYDNKSIPHTYDENGRLVQLGDTFFEYNSEGRLSAFISNSDLITWLTPDPDGRFVIVIPLVFGALTISEILTARAIATATTWAGYELYKRADQISDIYQHWVNKKTYYSEYEIDYSYFSPLITTYHDDGTLATTGCVE